MTPDDLFAADEHRQLTSSTALSTLAGLHAHTGPSALTCVDCGMPIERPERSHRVRCDACGRKRKTKQQRAYRKKERPS